MELKKVDLTSFVNKISGALQTGDGSSDITNKTIFVKGNMINGELQGVYSGAAQDQSNSQECASIPIYLFAAPPSAVHQFSVANVQDNIEKNDESLASPFTFYSTVSTTNPQLISFVSKANTTNSPIKDGTHLDSSEVLNSFVLGNNHLSAAAALTLNKSNETMDITQGSMDCFNITDATSSVLKKDCGLQTCNLTKRNDNLVPIILTEPIDEEICDDDMTIQNSSETEDCDFGDLSSIPLCEASSMDNVQPSNICNDVINLSNTPAENIASFRTAEELLRAQPELYMSFNVEAEIADFSGTTVGREITTQTVPLRKPNNSRKKVDKNPITERRRNSIQPELKVILTTDDDSMLNASNVEREISRPYKCSKCSLKFSHQTTLDNHIKCHPPNAPDDKRYVCYVCGYYNTQWIKMHNHLFTHGLKKPFTCDKCSFSSLTKGDLLTHMYVHSSAKLWECPKCHRSFKHRRNMKSHFRTCLGLDTDGKPLKKISSEEFVCRLCQKQLSNKRSLDKHMEIHMDVKPFVCNVCGYATRLKESLITHKRLHTGEKPFKCDVCDYSTPDKSSLRRHKRKHTNEKPYACKFCDYKAIQKHCLDTHVHRKHTGEKFVCGLCKYETYHRYALNQHFKLQHRDEFETTGEETCIVNVTPAVVLNNTDAAGSGNLLLMPASSAQSAIDHSKVRIEDNQQPSTSDPVQNHQSDGVVSSALVSQSLDGQHSAIEVMQQIQQPGDVVYVQDNGSILIKKEDGRVLIIQQVDEETDEVNAMSHS